MGDALDVFLNNLCHCLELDPTKFRAHVFNELEAAVSVRIYELEKSAEYAMVYDDQCGEWVSIGGSVMLRMYRFEMLMIAIQEYVETKERTRLLDR